MVHYALVDPINVANVTDSNWTTGNVSNLVQWLGNYCSVSHLTTATVLYFNISSHSTCASNVYLLNLSKFCRDISEQAHSILTQMSHPPYRASNRMQLED